MKRSTLVLLLMLSACGSGAEEPAANQPQANAAEPAPAEPSTDVPSLVGQWTITQIDGAAPRQTWPMTAVAADGRFTIQSECARFAWDYRQQGNIIQFATVPAGGCARTPSPAEEMIEQPVEQANIAMFSSQGREVLLSGPGGTVAMTRR